MCTHAHGITPIQTSLTHPYTNTFLCNREPPNARRNSDVDLYVSDVLSHKYGYRPIPRVVEATEFERLLSGTSDEQARDTLNK